MAADSSREKDTGDTSQGARVRRSRHPVRVRISTQCPDFVPSGRHPLATAYHRIGLHAGFLCRNKAASFYRRRREPLLQIRGRMSKPPDKGSRVGRSRFQPLQCWMRPRSGTRARPHTRDFCAPPRSHPREAGRVAGRKRVPLGSDPGDAHGSASMRRAYDRLHGRIP